MPVQQQQRSLLLFLSPPFGSRKQQPQSHAAVAASRHHNHHRSREGMVVAVPLVMVLRSFYSACLVRSSQQASQSLEAEQKEKE